MLQPCIEANKASCLAIVNGIRRTFNAYRDRRPTKQPRGTPRRLSDWHDLQDHEYSLLGRFAFDLDDYIPRQ
eukprot:3427003-Prorocentrum_lima.AAC.1